MHVLEILNMQQLLTAATHCSAEAALIHHCTLQEIHCPTCSRYLLNWHSLRWTVAQSPARLPWWHLRHLWTCRLVWTSSPYCQKALTG